MGVASFDWVEIFEIDFSRISSSRLAAWIGDGARQ